MSAYEYERRIRNALEGVRVEAENISDEKVTLSNITATMGGPHHHVTVNVGLTSTNLTAVGNDKQALKELREGVLQAARDYAAS